MTPEVQGSAGAPAPARFNPSRMQEIEEQAGSRDIVYELVDLFLADVEQRLTELAGAVREQSAEQRERVAHSIKGSCANLGAERMAELAAGIERCPETEADERLAVLLDEFAQLRPVLAERYPRT